MMAKPAGPKCNLACDYCYYLAKDELYPGRHSFKMSDATLERYIRQYIEASSPEPALFTWHGGEPTLRGLAFFERVVELQRRFCPPGASVVNNLQTNGVLIDASWAAFLARNGFHVGLSIDGPMALHDQHRLDLLGRPTHERVLDAFHALMAEGVEPALMCTVNDVTAAHPREVYRYLRDLGARWLQFLPVVGRDASGRPASWSVKPEAYGRFLINVFDEWAANDVGRVSVQMFEESMRIFSGHQPLLCTMSRTCGRVVVVEHNGDVYSCDHFVRPENFLGNIHDTHLSALATSPRQRDFGQAKSDSLPQQCLRCPVLFVCNGGCPKDRFAPGALPCEVSGVHSASSVPVPSPGDHSAARAGSGTGAVNYLCAGYRSFFDYVRPVMEHVAGLRQARRPGEDLVEAVVAAARRRREGIGRNDPCPCSSGRKAKHCCFGPDHAGP